MKVHAGITAKKTGELASVCPFYTKGERIVWLSGSEEHITCEECTKLLIEYGINTQ